MALNEKTVKKILTILTNAFPTDLSIEEVAKRAGIHRNTASKYLAVLLAKEKVSIRSVGKVKLYRIRKD